MTVLAGDVALLQVHRDLEWLRYETSVPDDAELVGLLDDRVLFAMRLPVDGMIEDGTAHASGGGGPVVEAAVPNGGQPPAPAGENAATGESAGGDLPLLAGGTAPPALDPPTALARKLELVELLVHTMAEHPSPRWAAVIRGWLRTARVERLMYLSIEQLEKAAERDAQVIVNTIEAQERAVSAAQSKGKRP